MSEAKDKETHEEFERQQEKDGVAIHLPRGPINPKTGKVDVPADGKRRKSK